MAAWLGLERVEVTGRGDLGPALVRSPAEPHQASVRTRRRVGVAAVAGRSAQRRPRTRASPAGCTASASTTGNDGRRSGQRAHRGSNATAADPSTVYIGRIAGCIGGCRSR